MRLLLDTHALIWWVEGSSRLGTSARAEISSPDNEVFVSAASAMEIATKFRLGKLPGVRRLAESFVAEVAAEGFIELPITPAHGQRAGLLDIAHKDPFDRVLIAQVILEGMHLVSNEQSFDGFGVSRLW